MTFIAFYSNTHVMLGEVHAKKLGLAVTMLPTPYGVAGGCSHSLRLDGSTPVADGDRFLDTTLLPCSLWQLDEATPRQLRCKP